MAGAEREPERAELAARLTCLPCWLLFQGDSELRLPGGREGLPLPADPGLEPSHATPSASGRNLLEDFLKPLGISQYRLAKDIQVPLRRVNEIVLWRRGISADTAWRLARYFKTTPQFWLNLQSHSELETARLAAGKEIERSIRPARACAEAA
jgi:antitoxin HigA-1